MWLVKDPRQTDLPPMTDEMWSEDSLTLVYPKNLGGRLSTIGQLTNDNQRWSVQEFPFSGASQELESD